MSATGKLTAAFFSTMLSIVVLAEPVLASGAQVTADDGTDDEDPAPSPAPPSPSTGRGGSGGSGGAPTLPFGAPCPNNVAPPDEGPPGRPGDIIVVGDAIRRAGLAMCNRYPFEDFLAAPGLATEPYLLTVETWRVWVTVGSLSDITEPVVARAVALVPYPEASFDPEVADPWTYVNATTSMWVEDWRTQAASDTQFGITVTVTVTPEALTWDPGDGVGGKGCGQASGPGQCTHTYARPAGGLDSTVTQTWQIAIDRTLGGDEVRPLVLSSDYGVRVAEIQTVVET